MRGPGLDKAELGVFTSCIRWQSGDAARTAKVEELWPAFFPPPDRSPPSLSAHVGWGNVLTGAFSSQQPLKLDPGLSLLLWDTQLWWWWRVSVSRENLEMLYRKQKVNQQWCKVRFARKIHCSGIWCSLYLPSHSQLFSGLSHYNRRILANISFNIIGTFNPDLKRENRVSGWVYSVDWITRGQKSASM